MTDTALPPGCAPLTFDPNDRATWEGKVYVPVPGKSHSARIDAIDMGGTYPIAASIATDVGRRSLYYFAPDGEGQWGASRLYDAAPEPVKPSEWWAIRRTEGDWWGGPYPDRARAESALHVSCRDDLTVVRLIEGDQA